MQLALFKIIKQMLITSNSEYVKHMKHVQKYLYEQMLLLNVCE